MGRPKIQGSCSHEDCIRPLSAKGFCQYHYNINRITKEPDKKVTGLRANPLYNIWFERKQNNLLCHEWLDFREFLKCVEPKPEGNFLLIRLTDLPYGPNNFKWQEHLKRKDGESKKDWWARKWASRRSIHPGFERNRMFRRKYGITTDSFNAMLSSQNFVCAICSEPETCTDPHSGGLRRLSVDHCHKTGKVRELLCWRCNGSIGKVKESVELLEKMILYINKHKEV